MRQDDFQPGGDRFPLTRRSVIEAARCIDAQERERALEALCAAYWRPVYKYVRWRWNRPVEAAQDLTQGFFAELLERGLLDKFDPNKSRLRTYLRVCVDSLVMNEDKAGRRQKRGSSIPHVALDFAAAEEELGATDIDPAKIASPESLEEFFEKEWVRSLFALAVEDLRKLCEQRERARTFGSTIKGLIAGVAAGIFARKVNSVPLGILFGLAVGFALAFLLAYLQHGYYFEIIFPGSIVGLFVGYATQRCGAAPTPATR